MRENFDLDPEISDLRQFQALLSPLLEIRGLLSEHHASRETSFKLRGHPEEVWIEGSGRDWAAHFLAPGRHLVVSETSERNGRFGLDLVGTNGERQPVLAYHVRGAHLIHEQLPIRTGPSTSSLLSLASLCAQQALADARLEMSASSDPEL